jgi:hypothetical protein
MANKFVIGLAIIVSIMALLVAFPRIYTPNAQSASFSSPSSTQFNLEYDKPSALQQQNSSNTAASNSTPESLVIAGDGHAILSEGGATKSFQLTNEELSNVKSLALDTGFMNIQSPSASSSSQQQLQSGDIAKYSIKVQTANATQQVSWFQGESNSGTTTVSPIINHLQGLLDSIIATQEVTP